LHKTVRRMRRLTSITSVLTKQYAINFPKILGMKLKRLTGAASPLRAPRRPATVVAPASRSTSSKKIVLKQSQLMIAKKLGLTPEQYAREFAKTQEN
jgi:hypothetical protein